jgi:hypothetical protein
MAGVTGQQEMLTPHRHLIPGICVCQFVYLTCNSYFKAVTTIEASQANASPKFVNILFKNHYFSTLDLFHPNCQIIDIGSIRPNCHSYG